MKAFYSKVTSLIASSVISFTAISNNIKIPTVKSTTASSSYRTNYTIYGDLDNDRVINSFDMVLMRKAIMDGEYYEKADLNCDEKVDNSDLQILRDYILVDSYIIDAIYMMMLTRTEYVICLKFLF